MRIFKFRIWNTKGKCWYTEDHVKSNFFNYLERTEEPILQFTGLLDRHGKEIYEGDVIKEKNGEVSLVEYNYWGCPTVQGLEFHFLAEPDTKLLCEVIGNMYEDQKLLPTPPKEEK